MRFGVICVSDRCSSGLCSDKSGPVITEKLSHLGNTESYVIVPDEAELISREIIRMCDETALDVVFTTGGTGFTKRDVTPEATMAVIERNAPGIAEAIRAKSLEITPMAMLSRAVAGIRKSTLVINLPGSPKAVKEAVDIILPVLPHAAELLKGGSANCGGDYK